MPFSIFARDSCADANTWELVLRVVNPKLLTVTDSASGRGASNVAFVVDSRGSLSFGTNSYLQDLEDKNTVGGGTELCEIFCGVV